MEVFILTVLLCEDQRENEAHPIVLGAFESRAIAEAQAVRSSADSNFPNHRFQWTGGRYAAKATDSEGHVFTIHQVTVGKHTHLD